MYPGPTRETTIQQVIADAFPYIRAKAAAGRINPGQD